MIISSIMKAFFFLIALYSIFVSDVVLPASLHITLPAALQIVPGIEKMLSPLLPNGTKSSAPGAMGVDWTPAVSTAFNQNDTKSATNTVLFPGKDYESFYDIFWIQNDSNCPIENGVIYHKGICSRLLHNSACKVNQWLVVNQEGLTECVSRPCPQGELFYQGRCVNILDDNVCGISEILYVEFTGEVYCDCLPSFIYDIPTNSCLAQHRQGSCPEGKVLEMQGKQVTCVETNCSTDDMIFSKKHGQCFNKTFEGTCAESGNFIVFDKVDKTAKCVSPRNIFEVPALTSHSCPTGSKKDLLNQCQTVFRRDESGSPLSFRVPSVQISRYSCPSPYVRMPNGVCKKATDTFII